MSIMSIVLVDYYELGRLGHLEGKGSDAAGISSRVRLQVLLLLTKISKIKGKAANKNVRPTRIGQN
jgi:hypothetical protein